MTTRIAFISDIHSNRHALEALLLDIEVSKCDDIINLGDNIAIGPDPNLVLDLLEKRNIKTLIGNHDAYYLFGLDNQLDINKEMHRGEYDHQKWTHNTLGEAYKSHVKGFDLVIEKTINNKKLVCMHYPHKVEDHGLQFSVIIKDQTAEGLRGLFDHHEGDIFIFGHHHQPCSVFDEDNNRYYINPGSGGCSNDNKVTYVIVEICIDSVRVEHRKVEYDKEAFIRSMMEKKPPEFDNVLKWFHGVEL